MVKKKTTYLPIKPSNETDFSHTGDEGSDAKEERRGKDITRRRNTIENTVEENLNQRMKVRPLTRREAIQMKTAAKSPTESRVEAIAAKNQRITDEYSDEIQIPAWMVSLDSRSPQYRNVRTNQAAVVIPSRKIAEITKEYAGAGCIPQRKSAIKVVLFSF